MTALEREEAKKKEKMEQRMSSKKDDNEEVDRSTWAKYSLGLKHQVFGNHFLCHTSCWLFAMPGVVL